MNHIDTKCAEEKKAREEFAEVAAGEQSVASEEVEKAVRDLLALRHKMDEDELASSRLKAVIMNAMKNSERLVRADGTLLATWLAGARKKVIDYKAIMEKYLVKNEDIEANTTYKSGSRIFSIEEV